MRRPVRDALERAGAPGSSSSSRTAATGAGVGDHHGRRTVPRCRRRSAPPRPDPARASVPHAETRPQVRAGVGGRCGDRIGERVHAAAQRDEHAQRLRTGRSGGPALRRGRAHRPPVGQAREQQAPVLALGGPELRHHGVEAQLVDRGPVDAADQRPGQPLHERVAEPPPQERADRHVVRAPAAAARRRPSPSGASRATRTAASARTAAPSSAGRGRGPRASARAVPGGG